MTCPLMYWSNEQRDACIPKPIELLAYDEMIRPHTAENQCSDLNSHTACNLHTLADHQPSLSFQDIVALSHRYMMFKYTVI